VSPAATDESRAAASSGSSDELTNVAVAPIGRDGQVKVTDFGIARAVAESALTLPGTALGSVHYFSPEQARGETTTEAGDIFSLGIVLFEMLTGERLFTGDTDLTILEQVRDARVVAPSTKKNDAKTIGIPAAGGAIVGGIIGGWLAQVMGFGATNGLIAAIVVATLGSIVVRLILNAMGGNE